MVEKSQKYSPEPVKPEIKLKAPTEKDVVKASAMLAEKLTKDKRFERGLFTGFGVETFQNQEKKFLAATVHLSHRPKDEIIGMLPTEVIVKKTKKSSVSVPIIYSVSGKFQLEEGTTKI